MAGPVDKDRWAHRIRQNPLAPGGAVAHVDAPQGSTKLMWLMVPLAISAVWMLVIVVNVGLRRRWKSLPTLDEYLERHPGCRTGRGILCAQCHSSSIRNWGLYRANSSERVFICNHCGEKLYRCRS